MQPVNYDRYFNALKPDLTQISDGENEDNQKPKTTASRNPWFNEFWELRFGCSLKTSIECRNQRLNETNWDSKLQFIVDATYVFAQALHMYFNCSTSSCTNASLNGINGTKLFRIILEQPFSSRFGTCIYICQINLRIESMKCSVFLKEFIKFQFPFLYSA